FSVDEGAVAAAEVADPDQRGVDLENAVVARHVHMGEGQADVAVARPADDTASRRLEDVVRPVGEAVGDPQGDSRCHLPILWGMGPGGPREEVQPAKTLLNRTEPGRVPGVSRPGAPLLYWPSRSPRR